MKSWCKVASNLDSHPRIRRAGRNGREVFLFALRRNAEPDNPVPGRVPAVMLEPWYVADQLMMTEDEAVTGVTAAVTAGLLVQDGQSWVIVGWESDWGKTTATAAERTAKWRESKKRDVTRDAVTSPKVTDVTRDACDALDQIRSEEIRREEKREQKEDSAAPSAGVSVPTPSISKRRKSKPRQFTPEQREIAMRVLGKLGECNGVRYTGSDAHIALIADRLADGIHELELRAIIAHCASPKASGGKGWEESDEMRQYLCPETLFGPKTHTKYLDPARTQYRKQLDEQLKSPQLRLVEGA